MSFALFMDGDMGEQTGKLVTFIINMVSLSLGFILIPLLPMPLPYIVAFLVAYATYKEKPYGMITGSLLISLGLIYHLSRIGFFQIFQGPLVKIIILSFLIAPFAVCPAIISNNLHIIAIDMGIIAVALLFFDQTFYLAIPLILVFATVYKGRGIAFTFIYYAFISIPLQVIQYLKTFQEGVFPPLYTPLSLIYSDIQGSLSYINLDELHKVFNSISEIFLSTGFERYVTDVPNYIVENLSRYLLTDYLDYIRSLELPASYAPQYVLDSFMEFISTHIPIYENSVLPHYVNATLPEFFTRYLDPNVWAALPSVSSGVLKLQIDELFPEYVNYVFQTYFREAMGQLLNSVPGIVFFLVIMMGFISAITLLNMNMPDPVKESVIPGKYVDFVIYLPYLWLGSPTSSSSFPSTGFSSH